MPGMYEIVGNSYYPPELIGAAKSGDDFLGIFGDDDDDVSGDDDDDDVSGDFVGNDFVGARIKRAANKLAKQKIRKMALRAKQTRGLQAVTREQSEGRQIFFGNNAVGNGGALSISCTIEEMCRPVRMVVSAYVTADNTAVNLGAIRISDIKVGTRSQFTNNGQISAELFRADSTSMMQGFLPDTVMNGTTFSVQIANSLAANTYVVSVVARTLR